MAMNELYPVKAEVAELLKQLSNNQIDLAVDSVRDALFKMVTPLKAANKRNGTLFR